MRRLELVLQQRERVRDDLVEVDVGEFGGAGAREIQQAVDDLGGAEGLPGDLFQQPGFLRIALHLLGQHLRVGGNHRQRRVDFVRHARGQQADDESLSACESCASSSTRSVMSSMMMSRPITLNFRVTSGAMATFTVRVSPAGVCQPELVEVVDARILPHPVKLLARTPPGNTSLNGRVSACQRGSAYMTSICEFQLSMRSSRSTRQHADVDRLDDVLVEFLQPLVLGDFLLQRGVQRAFWMAMPM